jgi:hypothetical protein
MVHSHRTSYSAASTAMLFCLALFTCLHGSAWKVVIGHVRFKGKVIAVSEFSEILFSPPSMIFAVLSYCGYV